MKDDYGAAILNENRSTIVVFRNLCDCTYHYNYAIGGVNGWRNKSITCKGFCQLL